MLEISKEVPVNVSFTCNRWCCAGQCRGTYSIWKKVFFQKVYQGNILNLKESLSESLYGWNFAIWYTVLYCNEIQTFVYEIVRWRNNALSNVNGPTFTDPSTIHRDPLWSSLILIDPRWSSLILIDPHWSSLILFDPHWSPANDPLCSVQIRGYGSGFKWGSGGGSPKWSKRQRAYQSIPNLALNSILVVLVHLNVHQILAISTLRVQFGYL